MIPHKPSPERLKALKRMPYSLYLLTPEWQILHNEMLGRAGYRCQLCNSDGILHVHHRTYERKGHEDYADLIVLCEECHTRFHDRLPQEQETEIVASVEYIVKDIDRVLHPQFGEGIITAICIGEEYTVKFAHNTRRLRIDNARFASHPDAPYRVGQKVEHQFFGRGEILAIKATEFDRKADVQFDSGQQRHFDSVKRLKVILDGQQ